VRTLQKKKARRTSRCRAIASGSPPALWLSDIPATRWLVERTTVRIDRPRHLANGALNGLGVGAIATAEDTCPRVSAGACRSDSEVRRNRSAASWPACPNGVGPAPGGVPRLPQRGSRGTRRQVGYRAGSLRRPVAGAGERRTSRGRCCWGRRLRTIGSVANMRNCPERIVKYRRPGPDL
jgi:hypothetical protein